MKYVYVIGLVVYMFCVSCSSAPIPLNEKLHIVVNNLERNGEHCTEEQLARYEMQYQTLMEEFEQNSSSMSVEELKLVAKEVARYNGLKVRYGLQSTTENITNLIQLLPDMAEGFIEGFETEGGLKTVEKEFKLMLDEAVKTSEQFKQKQGSVESIEQSVERISEDVIDALEKIDSIFSTSGSN